MKKCVFCEPDELASASTIEKYEKFTLRLDPNPVSFGHILVIPNRHVEKFDELDEDELLNLGEAVTKSKKLAEEKSRIKEKYSDISEVKDLNSNRMIDSIIREKEDPEGFNIGLNEGKAAGQTIDHLHIHVIPRYEGDVENPEGGIRNVIPERADYT
jgi:diadenosine tetraphosphate (Ap4A) HIT family hydrolase